MMDPALAQHLLRTMSTLLDEMSNEGMTPIVMVTAELRLAFKRFFEASFPRMSVLSYQELPENVRIDNFGLITSPKEALPEPVSV